MSLSSHEYVGIGIVAAGILALIYLSNQSHADAVVAPTAQTTTPSKGFNYTPSGFAPANLTQFNASGQPALPVVQGNTTCACSCENNPGALLLDPNAYFQTLEDSLTPIFKQYVANLTASIPSSLQQFLNNAEGGQIYATSQQQIVNFSQSTAVQLVNTGRQTVGGVNASGYANNKSTFTYGAAVTGANITQTY